MTNEPEATTRDAVNGLLVLLAQLWGILLILGLASWTLPGGTPRWGEVLTGIAVLVWADVNANDLKLKKLLG